MRFQYSADGYTIYCMKGHTVIYAMTLKEYYELSLWEIRGKS